jgi:hypothetical protein
VTQCIGVFGRAFLRREQNSPYLLELEEHAVQVTALDQSKATAELGDRHGVVEIATELAELAQPRVLSPYWGFLMS